MNRVPIGQTIDRYRVEGLLGQGGMAIVYKVRHVELHTLHAMKILTLRGEDLAARLVTEGRIQARMRHRNIVAVTDAFRIGGQPALVMEYVDGPPLDVLLRTYQPTLAQADQLAQGILAGVSHAHAMGLVHRDLKPGNVLVVVEGGEVVPKVTDFGIAKLLTEDLERAGKATRTGVSMGTPTFMAPEQFKNAKTADARSDVFSLGALLYELVTGAPAFNADNLIDVYQAMLVEKYRRPAAWRENVPERMERAIEGALKAKPGERWPTCERLLEVWRGEDRGAYTPLSDQTWEPHHVEIVQKVPRSSPPPVAAEPTTPEVGANPTITPGSVLLDSDVRAIADRPPRRIWPLAVGVIGGAALLGTVLGIMAVGGVWLGSDPTTTEPPVVASTFTAEPVPAPVPVPDPEPPAALAAVGPSPAPVDAHRPEPAPRRTVVVPAPAPASVVVPEPVPQPPSSQATVHVSGVERAYLVDPAGARQPVGAIDPGTYDVLVFFDPADPTIVLTDLQVAAGQEVTLRCNAVLRMCYR